MHHPTDRITHTTTFVTPVVEHWLEREIAQWVHHEGSIRRLSEHSYHGATSRDVERYQLWIFIYPQFRASAYGVISRPSWWTC